MDNRKRIALNFSYDERWIGGTYYVLNIVHALNLLPEKEMPLITICSENKENFDFLCKETAYPYLSFFQKDDRLPKYHRLKQIVNFILYLFRLKPLFRLKKKIRAELPDDYDFVFPNPEEACFDLININHKGFWIPDFQEAYLPGLFSDDEMLYRKTKHLYMAIKAKRLVLSSKDAYKDFQTLYPFAKSQTYVLPFAVFHPDYSSVNWEILQTKYQLSGRIYFFSPNQFWVHKNQKTIIEAVQLLKEKGLDVLVVFTGKEHDYRQPDYFEGLQKFVSDNDLKNNIYFLGFIDRKEQLQLMNHSKAMIQASLFEGWNTSVEDAKAMNKFVIASDICIHREQLEDNVFFFSPTDKYDLADQMTKVLEDKYLLKQKDYSFNQRQFAENIQSIL